MLTKMSKVNVTETLFHAGDKLEIRRDRWVRWNRSNNCISCWKMIFFLGYSNYIFLRIPRKETLCHMQTETETDQPASPCSSLTSSACLPEQPTYLYSASGISNSDIIFIKGYSFDTFSIFIYISTPVISKYWYLKVKFPWTRKFTLWYQ